MLWRTTYPALAIVLHLFAAPIVAIPLTPEDGNTCSNPPWDSTVKNWQKQKVDENLRAYCKQTRPVMILVFAHLIVEFLQGMAAKIPMGFNGPGPRRN